MMSRFGDEKVTIDIIFYFCCFFSKYSGHMAITRAVQKQAYHFNAATMECYESTFVHW